MKHPVSRMTWFVGVFVLAVTVFLPVSSFGEPRDAVHPCGKEWSIEGLRLGMPKADLEELHIDLEHFGMYGNDEHRTRNVDAGTWYRWRADTATGRRWNYASIRGNYANAPVVAITLFRDFYEWEDADLRRAISALVDNFGPPVSRDVPLKSTLYGQSYGTSKAMSKWTATTWAKEDCDVTVTAMYDWTRYGTARVTLFRIALTPKAGTVPGPAEVAGSGPNERSCDRWTSGRASLEKTLKSGCYYPLFNGVEEQGWTARQHIESLISQWGTPARDGSHVHNTQYYKAFGFPYKKERKWRATVWEDEHCDVIVTAFYREFKRVFISELVFGSHRYPVTQFALFLHSRSRTAEIEQDPELCRAQ